MVLRLLASSLLVLAPAAAVAAHPYAGTAVSTAATSVSVVPDTVSTTEIPVHTLPGTTRLGGMTAINADNWVVGTASQGVAALWRGEGMELLPTFNGKPTTGLGLNDAGVVVGTWESTFGDLGFRWADTTGFTLLPNPPNLYIGGDVAARDIDDNGDILTFYLRDNTGCPSGPNLRDASAILRPPYASTDYEVVPGTECADRLHGAALQDRQAVGFLIGPTNRGAFLWDSSTGEPTSVLGDWRATAVAGTVIAGNLFQDGTNRAVLWSEGSLTTLGTLGGPDSFATGVNSRGWVVGRSTTATGEEHAFVWTPEGGMVDLGTLGGTRSRAGDVNEAGMIVGEAADASGALVPVIWPYSPDRAPIIEPVADLAVPEEAPFELTPVVTDPDGDSFTVTYSGLPDGATVADGTLSWTPDESQGPSTHAITVTATQDDAPALTSSVTFVLTVDEVNRAPSLAPIGEQTASEGTVVEFSASGTDPDLPANTLTYAFAPVSGDLSTATIDPATGQFSCSCPPGEHVVEISVSDGSAQDSEDVTITVTPNLVRRLVGTLQQLLANVQGAL